MLLIIRDTLLLSQVNSTLPREWGISCIYRSLYRSNIECHMSTPGRDVAHLSLSHILYNVSSIDTKLIAWTVIIFCNNCDHWFSASSISSRGQTSLTKTWVSQTHSECLIPRLARCDGWSHRYHLKRRRCLGTCCGGWTASLRWRMNPT